MSSFSRQQLEDWLKSIDVDANNVLDVGGSQLPIEGRTKSWQVNEYTILDRKEPHECKRKPDMMVDLNYYNENLIVAFGESFDTVFCLEVMEYIWNPASALLNISQMTKKGGILYISFPFVYPMHNPVEEDYMRYTRSGAVKLLETVEFEIKEITPKTAGRDLEDFYGTERMKTASGVNHKEVGYMIKAIKL